MMDRFRLLAFSLVLLLTLAAAGRAGAQHRYEALVVDEHSGEPLAGVNVVVAGTAVGGATGPDGRVSLDAVPGGRQTILFSFVGFEPSRHTLVFPLADPGEVHRVALEEAHGELEEISVSATRTSRTIADQPTRVETIAGEEIDEKISMEPSNISMLLNESPGITVQQTSATSGNAAIRIQGLDGRYTQILKDGFPLYGGFSGGLAILQVPPLDLAQVEVIKGPSSTLYGGDAIAGLVNLVSKGPTEEPELSMLLNATSAGGLDAGAFYTARGERLGLTLLLTGNAQRAYDPDEDAFTNMPQTRRLTINPKLFVYPAPLTTLSLGISGTFEEREGGDVQVIASGPSGDRTFVERNASRRLTSQARMDRVLEGRGQLTLKNSVSLFERDLEVPGYRFGGRQLASYSEASVLLEGERHDLVAGVDVRTDAFREEDAADDEARDYTYASAGAFVQDTWDATDRLSVETGLRAELHDAFGPVLLPRASVLYRLSDALSARVGGGLGYKAPTIFLEPSEERAFRGVAPLSPEARAETSQGGSVDLNYRTLLFDRVALSFNQAFYFTDLQHPLVPEVVSDEGILRYRNAEGAIRTRALETNAKLELADFKLFLGYVYLDARADYDAREAPLELTPAHKTYTVLVYEKHGTGRIGLEAYYTGPQRLADGSSTEGYWITGLMGERRFGPARLFLNFENFLDTMQSNYAPVVLGPRSDPRFAEIWAPMDGFVVNGGVKYVW